MGKKTCPNTNRCTTQQPTDISGPIESDDWPGTNNTYYLPDDSNIQPAAAGKQSVIDEKKKAISRWLLAVYHWQLASNRWPRGGVFALRATFRLCSPQRAPKHTPW